jgi:hypothetical protein
MRYTAVTRERDMMMLRRTLLRKMTSIEVVIFFSDIYTKHF